MADKDLGFVSFLPGGDPDGWRPCLRVDEDGARPMVMRPLDSEQDADCIENSEVLELEHVAPGLANVRAIHGRPPLVNSRSYEEGWERIFGGSTEPGQA
jgi:hypothetical protein